MYPTSEDAPPTRPTTTGIPAELLPPFETKDNVDRAGHSLLLKPWSLIALFLEDLFKIYPSLKSSIVILRMKDATEVSPLALTHTSKTLEDLKPKALILTLLNPENLEAALSTRPTLLARSLLTRPLAEKLDFILKLRVQAEDPSLFALMPRPGLLTLVES